MSKYIQPKLGHNAQGVSALRQMDLQSNQLSRLDDLNLLRKYVCCLTHLNLSANPLSKSPSYQPLILRRLPHLATLDGRTLAQTDWEAAAASHGLLTVPMLEQCGSTRLLSIWSTLGNRLKVCPALANLALGIRFARGTWHHAHVMAHFTQGIGTSHLAFC